MFDSGQPHAVPERRKRHKREYENGKSQQKRPRNKPRMGRQAVGATLSGNIRVHENFRSMILGNQRNILVYLPPSYDEDDATRYPVLYVNDGQNVFDAATAYAGIEWELDETLEQLIEEGIIQEIIVVAIYNTPDRTAEYTYVFDPDDEEGGGNGDAYLSFIIHELRPFINRRYKTLKGPEYTGIMGSSLGGLSALYAGWKYPNIFSTVAAISPSLWWANQHLIKIIANDEQDRGPAKVWLDMGTEEGEEEGDDESYENIEDARLMGEVLLAKGYTLGEDLFYYEDEGGTHDEWSWGSRMDSILQALFPL